uniref:WD repeat-containing protein 79 n=1 Tax=Ditylenchus dipsaci TaxID=166011 RepID=A0A915CTT1_9BILA
MDAQQVEKETANPKETEVDVANSADDEEDEEEIVAEKQPKGTRAGFGLGFLLQQMRSASTTKTLSTKEAAPKVTKVTETITYEEQIVEVKKTPRPRIKVDYDFSAVTEKLPIQEVRDCFNSGTTPNFGFSKKVKENNYVRSCKWSPCGNWLIADSEDRRVRIFSYSRDNQKLDLHGSIRSGDLIYEVQWHPTEDLFASTSKDHPIHLWGPDANCNFHLEGLTQRMNWPQLFQWHFHFMAKLFTAAIANTFGYSTLNGLESRSKKLRHLVFPSPDFYFTSFIQQRHIGGSYAVGSFGGSIGLYSDQTGGCDCSFATSSPGVTQVQYSSDGNLLYAGYRKSDLIECFDLRFPVGMVLSTFHRPAHTNQKIAFQLGSNDRYLFSGSSTGDILAFDLKQGQRMTSIKEQLTVKPNWTLKASKAAVPGLSLHPDVPIVAITSGNEFFECFGFFIFFLRGR